MLVVKCDNDAHLIAVESSPEDHIGFAFRVMRILTHYLRILAENRRFGVCKFNGTITLALLTMRGWSQTVLIRQCLRTQKDSVVALRHVTAHIVPPLRRRIAQ